MIDTPQTLAEAKKYRYGQWAGNERIEAEEAAYDARE